MIVTKKILQNRDKSIFIDRLQTNLTYNEIGIKYNISGNRCRQIFNRVLRKVTYNNDVKLLMPSLTDNDIDSKYGIIKVVKENYYRRNKEILIAHLPKVNLPSW